MIITIDIQHNILDGKTSYTINRTIDTQKYTVDGNGEVQICDTDFDRICRAADNRIFNSVVKAIEAAYRGDKSR